MISFLKNLFFSGVIVTTVALLSMMVQKFYKENNVANIERPEHPIKVPANSRPILAPCDIDK